MRTLLSLLEQSVQPSVAFDFMGGKILAKGQYGSTFVRGSTGGRFNSAGLYEVVSANEPRLDYYPGTSVPRGLLMETQATNFLLHSSDLTQAVWTASSASVSYGVTSPSGASTASRVTASATDGKITQTITLASGSRAGSIYIRRQTGTGTVRITLDNSTWTDITSQVSGTWSRVSLVQTLANPVFGIQLATSGDAVDLWVGQVETGPEVSSAIPTSASTVARSADGMTVPMGYRPWYVNKPYGSYMIHCETVAAAAYTRGLLDIGDNTTSNRIQVRTSSDSLLLVHSALGTLYTNNTSAGTFNWNGLNGIVVGWNREETVAYVNGVFAVRAAGLVNQNAILAQLNNNLQLFRGNPSTAAQGWVRRVAYYPRRLPLDMLAQLSQPY